MPSSIITSRWHGSTSQFAMSSDALLIYRRCGHASAIWSERCGDGESRSGHAKSPQPSSPEWAWVVTANGHHYPGQQTGRPHNFGANGLHCGNPSAWSNPRPLELFRIAPCGMATMAVRLSG